MDNFVSPYGRQKYTCLSFFSGAMGLDVGLENAGFKTLLACEPDKICKNTIKKNRPNIQIIDDIRDYSANEIRLAAGLKKNQDIDLIAGGPPCQAFSTAGRRKGLEDERGNVFLKFVELITELRPKVALIENVRGLLSSPLIHREHNRRGGSFPPLSKDEMPGGALLRILEKLREHGFGISFNLYNAANFGAPQVRERLIILCDRDGSKLKYLTPTNSEDGELGLPKWRTFRDAVQNLPDEEGEYIDFPEKRLKYYRMLGPGQNWRNLPEELKKEAMGKSYYAGGGKTGFLRRLHWDKPSPTVVTHPAMPATDLAHPVKDRPLSIQEYKRIQGFPDNWFFCGTTIQKYKQIGNAVPCKLGEAAGKAVVSFLRHETTENFPNFKYSRYKDTDEISWEKKTRKNLHEESQTMLPFGLADCE